MIDTLEKTLKQNRPNLSVAQRERFLKEAHTLRANLLLRKKQQEEKKKCKPSK